jgi:hypothetical protein
MKSRTALFPAKEEKRNKITEGNQQKRIHYQVVYTLWER